METINELNQKILQLTLQIQSNYPELSKYLSEMPETIPNEANPHIDLQTLQAYCESLEKLIEGYAGSHGDM